MDCASPGCQRACATLFYFIFFFHSDVSLLCGNISLLCNSKQVIPRKKNLCEAVSKYVLSLVLIKIELKIILGLFWPLWYESVAALCRFTKGFSKRQLGRQTSQSSLHSCCGKTMTPLSLFIKVTKSALPQKRVCLVASNMKVSCPLLITGRVEIEVILNTN